MGGCNEGQVEETESFGTIISAKRAIYTEIKNTVQKPNKVHYQINKKIRRKSTITLK
jgi:hypothetical protein